MAKKTPQEKLEDAQQRVLEIKDRLIAKKKQGFELIAKYNKEVEEISAELIKAEAKLEIRKEDLEELK